MPYKFKTIRLQQQLYENRLSIYITRIIIIIIQNKIIGPGRLRRRRGGGGGDNNKFLLQRKRTINLHHAIIPAPLTHKEMKMISN